MKCSGKLATRIKQDQSTNKNPYTNILHIFLLSFGNDTVRTAPPHYSYLRQQDIFVT